MASVRLQQVTRQFGTIAGISEISFEVPDGEFWVLLGPSGCGKSTILRTIAGLESITSGELWIGDRVVNQVPARQRDVAMVFQNYALYPHLSVAENLGFGLKMRRVPAAVRRERITQVAQMLGIAHLLDRKPRQLSGGQQQRVALGRAIARQPQVFLFDEPLSNLDAQLRDETRTELKQLHQRVRQTTLYVTHDQVEAMTLADQIVVLDRGRIQQIADPHTIYRHPANRMVATFLGSPPMALLPLIYDDGAFQMGAQRIQCPEMVRSRLQPTSGQRFELGMRPEHWQAVNSEAADLQVEVTVVEPLGRETMVRSQVLGVEQTIHLLLAGDRTVKPGDRLGVKIRWEQVSWFDPTMGQTLDCAV